MSGSSIVLPVVLLPLRLHRKATARSLRVVVVGCSLSSLHIREGLSLSLIPIRRTATTTTRRARSGYINNIRLGRGSQKRAPRAPASFSRRGLLLQLRKRDRPRGQILLPRSMSGTNDIKLKDHAAAMLKHAVYLKIQIHSTQYAPRGGPGLALFFIHHICVNSPGQVFIFKIFLLVIHFLSSALR